MKLTWWNYSGINAYTIEEESKKFKSIFPKKYIVVSIEMGSIDNIDDIEHKIAVLTSQIDDLERDNQELLENVKSLDNDLTSEKAKAKVNMRPENNMIIAIENVPRQMNLDIVNFKTRSVLAKVYELLDNKVKEKKVSKPVEEQVRLFKICQ